jgi:glycosyltransferase involved in cell wall biosynthesis
VITSGNEPLWYVPSDEQTVLAYTHSTPRFMYDLYNRNMDFGGVMGRLATLFNTAMRTVYESNVNRPDYWVANSDLVARRIRRYWNIPEDQIRTVYPPVDVHQYEPDDAETGESYVYLGRLDEMKRVDEAIKAFNQMPERELVVVGEGPDGGRLRAMANDNVRFTGFVDSATKREWFARARAVIYPPMNEDFGMVPIEALAAGTPVIAVNEGFQRWQVRDGVNGLLYDRGELVAAVDRFERGGVDMSEKQMAAWAQQFGIERFEREMTAAIADAQDMAAIESTIDWPDFDGDVPPDREAVADA